MCLVTVLTKLQSTVRVCLMQIYDYYTVILNVSMFLPVMCVSYYILFFHFGQTKSVSP